MSQTNASEKKIHPRNSISVQVAKIEERPCRRVRVTCQSFAFTAYIWRDLAATKKSKSSRRYRIGGTYRILKRVTVNARCIWISKIVSISRISEGCPPRSVLRCRCKVFLERGRYYLALRNLSINDKKERM